MANCETADNMHYHYVRAPEISLLSNHHSDVLEVVSCYNLLFVNFTAHKLRFIKYTESNCATMRNSISNITFPLNIIRQNFYYFKFFIQTCNH
jgi:hypothetical protein